MRAYRNIARVIKTHGRQGEVLVETLRGLPLVVEPGMQVALTPPALKRDRFSLIEEVSVGERSARVKFRDIDALDDAESIVGCYLLAREDELELGEFDVAFDDLIGREVVDDRYGSLGTISEIMETPANDVWCVDGPFGEVLIPVIEDVVIDLPETGAIKTAVMDGIVPETDESDATC